MGNPVKNDRVARYVEFIEGEGVLERMAQGILLHGSLGAMCREMGLPRDRVVTWLMGDVRRWEVYQRAEAEALMQEVVPIVDGVVGEGASEREVEEAGNVAVRKLRAETRMKLAGMRDVERYGPKGGNDVGAMAEGITEALQRISERRRKEKLVEQGAGGVGGEMRLVGASSAPEVGE